LERQELVLILESLLFSSETPIKLKKLHDLLPDIPQKELREVLGQLKEEYEKLNRSFTLREVANGYQLCTKAQYSSWIKKLKKSRPFRLSPATMETLAIIAYKQPIIRAEIEEIRGVDVGGILRSLIEKKLIKVMGKKDVLGKPLLYGTTSVFLTMFGLKGLNDLPSLEDIEELNVDSLPLFSETFSQKAEESPDNQKRPETNSPSDDQIPFEKQSRNSSVDKKH